MVEEIMSAYHVAYERDESGWWVASVREVRGCHTQGRTVDEARRRIRKAMELFVDDARSAKLVDNVKLPAPTPKAIRLPSRRHEARHLNGDFRPFGHDGVASFVDRPPTIAVSKYHFAVLVAHGRVLRAEHEDPPRLN